MKEQVLTGIDGKRVVIQTPENAEDLQKLYRAGTPGPVAFFPPDEAEAHDERWVTIKKSEEGKGRKLLLSDDGKILGGNIPKSVQGKSLKEAFTALKSKVAPPPSQKEDSPKETSELLKEIPGETAEEYLDKIFASHGLSPDGSKMAEKASPAKIVEEAQIKQMNKKLRIAMFGKDLDDPSDVTQKQREEAKASLVKALSAPLSKNEAVLDFVYADMGYTKEEVEDKLRRGVMSAEDVSRNVEFAVNSWIHGWAETSADHDPKALAMQRAAQEVFNLTGAKTEHFPDVPDRESLELAANEKGQEYEKARKAYEVFYSSIKGALSSEQEAERKRLAELKNSTYEAWQKARYAVHEVPEGSATVSAEFTIACKAFLKAQYDETQAYFKKHGITHLTLYRGMGGVPLPERTEKEQGELQNQLASVLPEDGGQHTFSQYAQKRRLKEMRTVVGEADLALQPISSFSTSYKTARSFGAGNSTQTVIACVVPVEQILSTAKTGFGCLSEGEVTVLAHQLKGKRVTLSRMGDLPRTEEEFHQAIGKLV